ncbi:hypothetical protein [Microbacterium soli]|uniref:Head-to-tail adaptor n=1 Tax=Microbacterium soli TaxID=446075 RepID=A0ABP7NM01_9MICO
MTTWYTVDDADAQARLLDAWDDAPIENLEVCGMILDAAREQVITYAPAPAPVEDGQPVPDPPSRYVLAQLQQAKNLWNAGRVSTGGEVGVDGQYTFTPRPLDKTIRQIIRPVDRKPHAL